MNAVLELDKTVVRRGGRAVLQVEHLSVIRGEVLAIIGPNGAGKSTLLRILGLLDRPTEGTVHFRGEVVDWRSPLVPLRRRMASAFQEPWLCDATVFSNVALGLRFRGLPSPAIRERAGHWLARFGVGHLVNRQARTLSGGGPSASRWRGPWSLSQKCCSSTSRSHRSTSRRGRPSLTISG